MGNTTIRPDRSDGDEFVLKVDDRGRVTLPQEVRERLGIEPDDRIPARVFGTVLELDPKPSDRLVTVAAGRTDWSETTPTDAGEALFGPMDRERK